MGLGSVVMPFLEQVGNREVEVYTSDRLRQFEQEPALLVAGLVRDTLGFELLDVLRRDGGEGVGFGNSGSAPVILPLL